jgi:hypothetical protein
MRTVTRFRSPFLLLIQILVLASAVSTPAAQKDKKQAQQEPTAPPALTRTTTRHEIRRLGYGGTLSIIGAPFGSITIESWPRNEVDLTATIELRADSEDDLTRLAAVDGFVVDSVANHLRIMTTGTHDKVFMKRTNKDFPKALLGMPFKIDYKLKVPPALDLEIDAGQGDFTLNGVEGAISFRGGHSDAKMNLTGGVVRAVIASGTVDVNIDTRSWRGAGASIQLASGTLNVSMPADFNADIDATVLRSGKLENEFGEIPPRDDAQSTDRALRGRAGFGGASLYFTVADGTLRLKKSS